MKVGLEKDTGRLVCNKCLYESSKVKSESTSQQNAFFTPLITKELKKRFDYAYATFKENRGDVAEIEPDHVKELFRKKSLEFFDSLRQHVKNSQELASEKIRNSRSLKELEDLMENNKNLLDDNSSSTFDFLKEKFDSKI